MGKNKIASLMLLAFAGFIVALALAGCGSGDGSSIRATATALAAPNAPQPEQPVEAPAIEQPADVAAPPVEVTRVVVQTVIVPDVREVVVTATPDIQGFPAPDAAGCLNAPAVVDSGMDESLQPCPSPFWVRGRCTATQAQIDAYAQGGN